MEVEVEVEGRGSKGKISDPVGCWQMQSTLSIVRSGDCVPGRLGSGASTWGSHAFDLMQHRARLQRGQAGWRLGFRITYTSHVPLYTPERQVSSDDVPLCSLHLLSPNAVGPLSDLP